MKFDDIVHFTGGRTVCPPLRAPSPFGHCQKSGPRRPATRHKRLALLLWYARASWVSRYPPARSVAGHLIPRYEGRTCVKSLACYNVLLISLEFVCASRMAPSRSYAFIDIKCCLSRPWISIQIARYHLSYSFFNNYGMSFSNVCFYFF